MAGFLIDQQLPRALAFHLTDLGHDAEHVKDYPHGTTLADAEIAGIADANGRIVVTNLVAATGVYDYIEIDRPGVIIHDPS